MGRRQVCKRSPGESVRDSYDVECMPVLGEGAFATVLKALHRRENKWYAVKTFSGDTLSYLLEGHGARGEVARSMECSIAAHLRREVEILQGLRHRNVCPLKEAFLDEYSVST